MNEYERFIHFVECSLKAIESEYYYAEYNGFHAFKGRLRNLGVFRGTRFIRHMERGFAYELYFQLRNLMIEYRAKNHFFPGYFLQGEIKKMDVPQILNRFGYISLGASFTPDLLLHIPSQDANAFVIEIKAQPELEPIEILYDLDKLARFLRRFNYKKAVFIAVNIDPSFIIEIIRVNSDFLKYTFTSSRLNDCIVIVKRSPDAGDVIFNQTLTQVLA